MDRTVPPHAILHRIHALVFGRFHGRDLGSARSLGFGAGWAPGGHAARWRLTGRPDIGQNSRRLKLSEYNRSIYWTGERLDGAENGRLGAGAEPDDAVHPETGYRLRRVLFTFAAGFYSLVQQQDSRHAIDQEAEP